MIYTFVKNLWVKVKSTSRGKSKNKSKVLIYQPFLTYSLQILHETLYISFLALAEYLLSTV